MDFQRIERSGGVEESVHKGVNSPLLAAGIQPDLYSRMRTEMNDIPANKLEF